LADLINAIKGQNGNFRAVLYVNGPQDSVTKQEFDTKVQELQTLTNNDPRFIIINNHYDSKKTIGTIRADMLDAISNAVDTTIPNPKVI
jgi:hypothetical protein